MSEKLYAIVTTLMVAVPEGTESVDSFLADSANEILREQQRSFNSSSVLIDYSVGNWIELQTPVQGYEEQSGSVEYFSEIHKS